jgi:chemotaxis protein CheC
MTLTDEQLDVLRELINIGVGRAAGVLNELLGAHVLLHVPLVRVFAPHEVDDALAFVPDDRIAAVRMAFKGSFVGTASLVFPVESAASLVNLLLDGEFGDTDIDSMRAGTLTEVGNIIINGVMGSISNMLHEQLRYSLPVYLEDGLHEIWGVRHWSGQSIVLARTHFTVQSHQIQGDIFLIFESASFEIFMAVLGDMV